MTVKRIHVLVSQEQTIPCVFVSVSILESCTDISDNSLKTLLVPREKYSVRMELTPRQWCAVLSGLKDAKTLKELNVDMSQVRL